MPVRWVVAHHEPTLQQVTAGLRDSAGVLVVGPAGIGKTELARAAAQDFAAARWVTGTAPEAAVPLGAMQRVIEVADVAKTAELLRVARASLQGAGLLVVDDAHHLDKLSATLVYQLVARRQGAPPLLVTLDSAHSLPDAIAALLRDQMLTVVQAQPLDQGRIAGLLQAVGAGEVPVDAAALAHASGGNALYLRHLVDLGVRGQAATDLPAAIGRYVMSLPPPVRAVMEYLAVDDPIPVAELTALTDQQALEQARADGAVRVDGALARPAHPLYAETVAARLSPENRARRARALAQRLAGARADVIDRLRVAVLALGGGSHPPAEGRAPLPVADMIASAVESLRLGDYQLAEQLARAALQRRSDALAARLALAHALAWQGRGGDAEAVLAEVQPGGLSESDLMSWALPRAANQFFMLGEPTRATAFLLTTRNRITDPSARATLDALSATFAMNAGTPARGLDIAAEVLASRHADGQAIGWAASAAALCCARMGRLDDVEPHAERALAAEQPGLLRFTSGLARTTALLMKGQLAEARGLAEEYTDFAELQQPGRAIGDVLVAHVAIAQGDHGTAVPLLERAADTLEPTGYSWGPLALMLQAIALGQRGDTAGAAKVLSQAESRHGMKSALFAPELALARAWAKRAARDRADAISLTREAARTAERGGQRAVALRALHDGVRLGDTGEVDRIARLAREVDCRLGALVLAHARALAGRDRAALQAVAAEFAAVGLHPAAADALEQAQRAVR